jgi:lipid-A-disaccharide synthase
MTQSIFMVAGERSGDVYGGELASALKARLGAVTIFGCGGEAMRKAGVETTVDSQEFALMGIAELIRDLPRARRLFNRLIEEVDRRKPALAVLIDSPSLNLRLAKKLKQKNIRVVYFVSPQIWAWKKWRIRHIKSRVDKMLCIFDFEEAIYKKAGVPVEFVGHPLLELVRSQCSRAEFFSHAGLDIDTPTVTLLPGSREKEIHYNLRTMVAGAALLASRRKVQFALVAAPSLDAQWLEARLRECDARGAAVRVVTHSTYDALKYSDVAIIASGTATVEAALLERPMVVVYRVSPFTWTVGQFMVVIPHYSMVNLLAGRPVVKELIQRDFSAENVAAQVEYLLDHADAREEMVREFRNIRLRMGPGGAILKAADAVVKELTSAH